MIHFFSKKLFLKDLLENFVDIHCHILPGIDDGAKNVNEAIDLIKKLTQLGVKQFIATPHIMQDFYSNNDVTIGDSYQNLLEAITSKKLKNIIINPAAEYMMDSHFEELLKNKNIFPLKGQYVLVEMSYFQPPINLVEIIYKIREQGYLPVLAHPERYAFYHKKKEYYKTLKELGCFFQLNLLSLSDHYGTNVGKTAHYLLDEQLIDFVATDTHNAYHIEKLSNIIINEGDVLKLTPIIKNTCDTFSVI